MIGFSTILPEGLLQPLSFAGKDHGIDSFSRQGIDILPETLGTAPHQIDQCLGGIVLVFHARRRCHLPLLELTGDGMIHLHRADGSLQLLQRHCAGTQQPRAFPSQGDDGGFHPEVAGATVHNGGHLTGEIPDAVFGCGGAGQAGQIGGRCRNGQTACPDNGLCHRVRGHPHRHGVQARR